jgi:hypothetical protein
MALTEKLNHVAEALDNLVQQFKGSGNLALFITSWVNEVQEQELEGMWFDLLENRWIATAIGAQLDGLGSIVGEDRQGRPDAEYRVAIIARVGINVGSGTPEQIITYVTTVTDGANVVLAEYFPAALTVRAITTLTVEEATIIGNLLKEIKAAGVKIDFIYGVSPESELKKFDIVGQGFDQGKFAGVI